MLGLLVLLFPLLLLGFMLFMQRVEEPLNKVATEREIEQFLEDANPAELDSFVREGTDSALRRFRNRLRRRLHRPSARQRRPGRSAPPPTVSPEATPNQPPVASAEATPDQPAAASAKGTPNQPAAPPAKATPNQPSVPAAEPASTQNATSPEASAETTASTRRP
jgi:hypothetical protein